MTTLVTGAGLLGASFAQTALERAEKVVFFDLEPRADFLALKLGAANIDKGRVALVRGDVRNLSSLIDAIQTHRVRTVIHTASLIGGRVQREISLAFDINIIGTRNVAEAVRLTGVKRLVHLSTFGAYDWRRPVPDKVDEDFALGPGRAYGNFKASQELILEAFAGQYQFELVMLRPANVFGLGHFWGGSSGGARMQQLMEAGLAGSTARIAAHEAMDVEYVYAKDVGTALDGAATVAAPRDQVFNIGSGHVTTFDELIAAVRDVYPKLQVEIEPGEKPSAKAVPMDISRAQRQLGWTPQFSLIDGLRDYHADLQAARAAANGA